MGICLPFVRIISQRSLRLKFLAGLKLGMAGLCVVGCTLGGRGSIFPLQWPSPLPLPQKSRHLHLKVCHYMLSDPDRKMVSATDVAAGCTRSDQQQHTEAVATAPKRPAVPTKWAPLPSPKQVWAHSCVTWAKLNDALADPSVTAFEVDVTMGHVVGSDRSSDPVPIMAHPPSRTSDLSFEACLEAVIQDGRRHVKFDFKNLASVELCLPMLAAASSRLAANRQAVWLNADVLPGPGLRSWSCAVPAEAFLAAAAELCPGAHLSLGWKVNPVGWNDTYTEADCQAMAALCNKHLKEASGGIVFAVAARVAGRDPNALAGLLRSVPNSQLLLWTGTWEPPVSSGALQAIHDALSGVGVVGCCGFDCQVLDPCIAWRKFLTDISRHLMLV
ncbi:unnamed protein product [Polarella glacialis]|uniref:Menorin-like domain-containing protein n=1 Tax=Polarella glacialis TaxID=89957 RepID=A0A813IH91_POLGL|nr:unnamed protein product [Polarella glacialis]CAE8650460.1 unnamed protein product [Polarella glacialis]